MTLRNLIDSVSLVDYVAQYATLQQRGREYWCESPINPNDRNPSFSIDPEKNVFCDFSSNTSGNVLNFIMAYDHCKFADAVKKLKAWANVTDDIVYTTAPIVKTLRQFKCDNRKHEYEHSVVEESELSRYNVRFFPYWEEEGITSETALRWGCGVDKFNQCLTIPIYDQDGNVINILCRTLVENASQFGIPKYIYRKKLGTVDFLWGWYQHQFDIIDKHQVILVEGCKSVMKLEQWGYDNAVAVLTSHLGDHQLPILIQPGCDVIVMFDHDVDPYKDENLQKLKRFCRVYICRDKDGLTGEKDSPCDCGRDVFETILANKKLMR